MARTPTIGLVIDDLGLGGAQKQLAQLATALVPHASVRVYVLSGVDEPHGARLRARGIPVTTLARKNGVDLARLRALARALRADRVDVVHGFLDASDVYAFLAARRLRVPVVLSLRSQRVRLTGWRARALRAMLRRADAVVVNSEAARLYVVDGVRVRRDRVVRVPNIVAATASVAVRDESRPVVGCVGRLVGLKRFDAVVRAFPLVRARVPAARLEIVGDGPELESLRALARGLGVADAAVFAGAFADAAPRIAHYACLVVASEVEGLPNVALEAMAAGVPVVAPPVGDLVSLVDDGTTGVVVREASPDALAQAIVRALTDAALRTRARDEGPRRVRERYSVDAALAALLPVYDRLHKRTGAAAVEATTPVLGE